MRSTSIPTPRDPASCGPAGISVHYNLRSLTQPLLPVCNSRQDVRIVTSLRCSRARAAAFRDPQCKLIGQRICACKKRVMVQPDLSFSRLRNAYTADQLKPSSLVGELRDKLGALEGAFVSLVQLEDLQMRCRWAFLGIWFALTYCTNLGQNLVCVAEQQHLSSAATCPTDCICKACLLVLAMQ